MQVAISQDLTKVWLKEPKWSWYGSPLWEVCAWRLTFVRYDSDLPMAGIRRDVIFENDYLFTIYLSDEEYFFLN